MKTKEEMIKELVADDMEGVRNNSMRENDLFILDVLVNGRKGYNNYTDEELEEEYSLYLMNNPKDEEDDDE